MFCPGCGAENPSTASRCGSCGAALPTDALPPGGPSAAAPEPPAVGDVGPAAAAHSNRDVPNHLAMSIVATIVSVLCCCLPFGMIAIIPASMVSSKVEQGDISGARTMSGIALGWSMLTLLVCLGAVSTCMLSSYSATAMLRSILGV